MRRLALKPNPRDLAEFALLALRFRILAAATVIEWADGIIESGDASPPSWVIDLALAKPNTVEDALKRVPGEAHAELPIRLFLALVRRRWQSGRLSIGDVRGIGWRLHGELTLPTPDGQADWGVCLEAEGEELDEGWRTEDDLRISIDEKLAEYSDVEPALPDWA
jgi:hypothetical protein